MLSPQCYEKTLARASPNDIIVLRFCTDPVDCGWPRTSLAKSRAPEGSLRVSGSQVQISNGEHGTASKTLKLPKGRRALLLTIDVKVMVSFNALICAKLVQGMQLAGPCLSTCDERL